MNKTRWMLVGGGVVVVLALVVGLVWFGPWSKDDPPAPDARGIVRGEPAGELADAFGKAWQTGTLDQVAFTAASGNVATESKLIVAGLSTSDQDHPTKVTVSNFKAHGTVPGTTTTVPSSTSGPGPAGPTIDDTATATLTSTWTLDPAHTWTTTTTLPLVEEVSADGGTATWKVAWTPAVVAPGLVVGDVLRTRRTVPTRAPINAADGQPLVGAQGVVRVGIQPSRTQDPAATARTVAALVKVDEADLVARVLAAKPTDFVPVVTLRRADYDAIRAQIQPLPGTVFQEDDQVIGVTKGFARALLGTVGPATQEIAAASKGAIAVGDETGLSGLQRSQNAVLAGTPGLKVEVIPKVGGAKVLKDFPAVAGKPVTITIDPKAQTAADAVMATAPKPAALVAIRVSTGDILAVANGPAGADGYNRALVGHYPPGSTFKVASGLTLLLNGLTPDTTVACPATITVGKVFRNAEGEVLGNVPFRTDFAKSCNTAFVGQSRTITAQQLTDTAGLLGYRTLDIGVPAFGGSVPSNGDVTEHAANMIGQGKVEASPFAVALASASVANGRSLNPRLIIDAAHAQPTFGAAFPAEPIAQLRELMRGVVTSGTGGALQGVPGGDVAGKTGTAEFGNEDPPETHAWFTGFQGDVAFAVLVEGGGFGGQVAAPIAARFLAKLATP